MHANLKDASFEKWLSERPKWLQTFATRLLTDPTRPNQTEINEFTELCIRESKKELGVVYKTPPVGSFAQPQPSDMLRIDKLEKVIGVNAIKHNASLSFGETHLAVVYGANGTGKSGFSRLLKQACGARVKSELLPNVFSNGAVNPSAEIIVNHNKESKKLNWSSSRGTLQELRHVHVFDTQTAANYISTKNEATYEPQRMRFISALIGMSDAVAAVLEARKRSLVKVLSPMPPGYAGTIASKFFSSLKYTTTQEEINQAYEFSEDEKDERIILEASLKQTDIHERLNQLHQKKANFSRLSKELQTLKDGYADYAITQTITARIDATLKRKAANEDAAIVFENAPLDGIGQESWRLLWEQARAYSELLAYSAEPFPVTEGEARCVLCQQPLDFVAKKRFIEFENFVKGRMAAQADAAETKLANMISTSPPLINKEAWNIKLNILNIGLVATERIYEILCARRLAADQMTTMEEVPALDWTGIEVALKTSEATLLSEEKTLNELQQIDKREVHEKRLNELKAKEWLVPHKAAIETEVKRLHQVKIIEGAESITRTHPLTIKKNELAAAELAMGYQERFNKELTALGGKLIPVELKTIQEGKGKISFALVLKGNKKNVGTSVVLSEGETRIVALSAFLADITGIEQSAPFIFDDPISSLDQDFEERVAKRLVDLAETRQIIIFTHRLSLVTLLDDAVDHITNHAENAEIPSKVTISIKFLRTVGSFVGMTSAFNMREKPPKTAFNDIRNHILPSLRKHLEYGEIAEYDSKTKEVCADFRILLEISVEKVLLNDVVARFRRSVQTKGKIRALSKIQLRDCGLFDDLMTRYSYFVHSQPQELPVPLPSLDELEEDLNKIINWIAEFKIRAVA
jgi:energy-coupling factor transporter ATP-binding protein EcfA2